MQYAFGNLAKQNQKASSSQPAQLQHQQQQQQLQKQENKKKQKKQSQHSNHRNSPEDSDSVSDNGMTTDSNTDDNISSSWSIVSSDSLDDFNDIVSTDGYSTDSADNEASEDSSDLATNLEDTVTDIKNSNNSNNNSSNTISTLQSFRFRNSLLFGPKNKNNNNNINNQLSKKNDIEIESCDSDPNESLINSLSTLHDKPKNIEKKNSFSLPPFISFNTLANPNGNVEEKSATENTETQKNFNIFDRLKNTSFISNFKAQPYFKKSSLLLKEYSDKYNFDPIKNLLNDYKNSFASFNHLLSFTLITILLISASLLSPYSISDLYNNSSSSENLVTPALKTEYQTFTLTTTVQSAVTTEKVEIVYIPLTKTVTKTLTDFKTSTKTLIDMETQIQTSTLTLTHVTVTAEVSTSTIGNIETPNFLKNFQKLYDFKNNLNSKLINYKNNSIKNLSGLLRNKKKFIDDTTNSENFNKFKKLSGEYFKNLSENVVKFNKNAVNFTNNYGSKLIENSKILSNKSWKFSKIYGKELFQNAKLFSNKTSVLSKIYGEKLFNNGKLFLNFTKKNSIIYGSKFYSNAKIFSNKTIIISKIYGDRIHENSKVFGDLLVKNSEILINKSKIYSKIYGIKFYKNAEIIGNKTISISKIIGLKSYNEFKKLGQNGFTNLKNLSINNKSIKDSKKTISNSFLSSKKFSFKLWNNIESEKENFFKHFIKSFNSNNKINFNFKNDKNKDDKNKNEKNKNNKKEKKNSNEPNNPFFKLFYS